MEVVTVCAVDGSLDWEADRVLASANRRWEEVPCL